MKKPLPLQFKVSSALKSVIGRDLITNDFVAIFELVKNSFDAKAKQIHIIFELEGHIPTIYIMDDGKGMSYNDIVEKWLFVAYSSKREGVEDKEKRVYAGNKGVGRFSCDRLGAKLELQARSEGETHVNVLTVDWGEFEKDAREYFSKINILYEERSKFNGPKNYIPNKSGVILKITELRDAASWDREKLLQLKLHLAKLLNPFGNESEKAQIVMHCSSERALDKKEKIKAKKEKVIPLLVNGIVKNPLLQTLGKKTTRLECKIENDFLYFDLWDRGQLIYKIREKLEEDEYKKLRKAKFRGQIFFFNRAAKLTFSKQMEKRSVNFGSLFLFRNGFRVFPIGEEGDDYWKLDSRKLQGHSRFLGNRDIMGRIDVYGGEDDFKEASSRNNGLIETEASRELRGCVLYCIKHFERYVVWITWQDELDKDYETFERMSIDSNRAKIIELIKKLADSKNTEILEYNKNILDILSAKSSEFESSLGILKKMAVSLHNDELFKKVKSAEKELKRAKQTEREALEFAEKEQKARRAAEKKAASEEEKRKKTEDALGEELKRNVFLAASSSRDKEQLENFIHQLIQYAADAKTQIENQLSQTKDKTGKDWEKNREVFYQLKESIEKVISTSRYLTMANFRLDSGKTEGDLASYIREHITTLLPTFTDGIDIICNPLRGEFNTSFSPIEIGMLLDNLVSNAKKAGADRINFDMKLQEGHLVVTVSDDGTKLSNDVKESPERVFEKGFTRTNGSGLGLYFCRQVMLNMSGEIKLIPPKTNNAFILILTFTNK